MGSAHGSVVKLRDKLMTGAFSEGCDGLPLALPLSAPTLVALDVRDTGDGLRHERPRVSSRVSKRLGSRYRSRRSPDWLKFKNPNAPAEEREAEEDWAK